MAQDFLEKNDDDIIFLLAKGIVKLFESNEGKSNYSILPRELKRGINILSARYNLVIGDRSEIIKIFSNNIKEWFNGKSNYSYEKLIEGGYPSDFCYDIAIDAVDIEGELEQKIILDIRNDFKLYGSEEDYKKFRSYLIKNTVVNRKDLEEFIQENSLYKPKLKKIYVKIYDFYEEIPMHYVIDDEIEICGYCGWTILNKENNKKCVSQYCKANMGLEKSKKNKYNDTLLRVKRGVMRYISLPGIPEIKLLERIESFKLPVKLYPNYDEYDLEIKIASEKWAIDVKDYGNPYVLVNKIKSFIPNSCDRSFIVVPNLRCKLNRDYKYILKAEDPIEFEFITERDLIKLIKEKI